MFNVRLITLVLALGAASSASAQVVGTFRWQFQPYCNVVTLLVTQVGSVFRMEGLDDQCGAAVSAAVSGLAVPNPDGTLGFGLTIVTTPGGDPVHVATSFSFATLGGTWRDSAGRTGPFVFTPGAGTGGAPRAVATPLPDIRFQVAGMAAQTIPSGVPTTLSSWSSVLYNDGGGTYTPGSGTYTAPATGLYMVMANVYWAPFNTQGFGVVIERNGTSIAQVFAQAATGASSNGNVQHVAAVYKLTAGDTVRISAFQNSGSAQQVSAAAAGASTFSVTLLR